MLKLNNLLNNLKYNKQGRLLQELKEIQEKKELVNKELSRIKIMPSPDLKVRNCYNKSSYYLADLIAQLWLGKIDADKFNSGINKMYKIENAINYFKDLGKKMYMVRKESIDEGEYNIEEMNDEWYIDKNYKNLALLEGKKIGVLY